MADLPISKPEDEEDMRVLTIEDLSLEELAECDIREGETTHDSDTDLIVSTHGVAFETPVYFKAVRKLFPAAMESVVAEGQFEFGDEISLYALVDIRGQAIDRALVWAPGNWPTVERAEQYGRHTAEYGRIYRSGVDRHGLLAEAKTPEAGEILADRDNNSRGGELWAAFNRGFDAELVR